MKDQNYKNHKRFVFGYHVIAFGLCVLFFIISILNLYVAIKKRTNMRIAVMFFMTSLLLLLMFFYLRIFALKAQDRAIKNEVNFRYYVLTGKMLDDKLKLSQIIALRFSNDEELKELTEKAISQNMSSDDIKKNIKNWKSDFNRV